MSRDEPGLPVERVGLAEADIAPQLGAAEVTEGEAAVEQQETANGGPTRQSSEDLRRAVERLLERADAVEFLDEPVDVIDTAASQSERADER